AGTYTVTAAFDMTSASVNFTIGKATPTVTVADAGGTYSGSAYGATTSVTGVNGADLGAAQLLYLQGTTVLSAAPVNAGGYTVVAHYAGSANYTAADSAAV